MHVAAASTATNIATTVRPPEAREVGPERDHDGDEATSVKSAPAQGVGTRVDIKA